MHLRFLCIFSWHGSSFLFSAKLYSLTGCSPVYVPIHLWRTFWFFPSFTNKAAVNISVQFSLSGLKFRLLWMNIKDWDCWIAGKNMLNIIRNFQTVFKSGLPSSSEWVPVTPRARQHLALSVCITVDVPADVWWQVIAASPCISLMYGAERLSYADFLSAYLPWWGCFALDDPRVHTLSHLEWNHQKPPQIEGEAT